MNSILVFFLAFCFCLISVISYGKIFEKLFLNNISVQGDRLVYTGFYGLMFLTIISLFTSCSITKNTSEKPCCKKEIKK